MQLSSTQENFKQGLMTVSHIAGKNVNLPILNNILIEAKDGNIKLASTNLEIGITCKIRGKIEKEGTYTVDSKILTDYISLLPNKKVEINLEGSNLEVQCENYKTKIKGQTDEEYPLIPKIDKSNYYLIKTDEFRKALSQVVFAVSTNEARLELSGVLFNFLNNKLVLAATDSYRLAEKETEAKYVVESEDEKCEEIKTIVPAKTIQEIIRILSGLKEFGGKEKIDEIKIYISENQILFKIDSIELTSRLIEGQYPDYKQIIPTNPKTKSIINRSEIVRAIKASSLFSKTGINDVSLDLPEGKNKLVITSESGQTGESVIELESSIQGADNGVMVNYRYLLDGLNNIDSENIKIEVIDNNTPCILKAEKENDYLYIIMPIKQ